MCIRDSYASDPQMFWRCKNVLEVLYHRAKFGGARISPTAGAAKNVEFFVCLFVCLICSSRFWTSEIVRQISPRIALAYGQILMPLDRAQEDGL